jgi:hypothetical protein
VTLAYTYDGVALTHAVKPSDVSLASGAEVGNPLTSKLVIEDPAGTLTLLGHRSFVVEESACSQPRLFTGWTTERGIGRAYAAGQFGNSTARVHDMSIIDLNALFRFRIISGTDGNRPEETSDARLAWLLGSSYLSGLIADTGFVISNTRVVDAADYRTRYPEDVMRDLMDRAVGLLNYFAFWDATAAAVGLWLNYVDVALGDSTLRISNVLSDEDSVTFPPEDDTKPLSRQPENVFSEVIVEYAHGTKRLFRSRASTATKYIRRGTTLSRPWTGKVTTARNQAEAFLNQHANELDRITVTIKVPAASVGLITVGQRMDVKFSHLPGYTSFTSMRTVLVRYRPTDDTAQFYFVDLELVAPRATTDGASDSYFSHAANLPLVCNSVTNDVAGGGVYWRHGGPPGTAQDAAGYRVIVGPGAARTVTVTVAATIAWGNYANRNGDCGIAISDAPANGPWDYFANGFDDTTAYRVVTTDSGASLTATFSIAVAAAAVDTLYYLVLWANAQGQASNTLTAVTVGTTDVEVDLPTPPAVTAIIDTINNLEYLGDIPLGLPEL